MNLIFNLATRNDWLIVYFFRV